MTNLEFAASLRSIAGLYERHADLGQALGPRIYANTKMEVQSVIKTIGGKWVKSVSGSEDWQRITFKHSSGLEIDIPRDNVCRKIVSYDCEPIMSPEEEAELLTEA